MFRSSTMMISSMAILFLVVGNFPSPTLGFVVRRPTLSRTSNNQHSLLTPMKSTTLPTLEESSTDPFMKQVGHAAAIVDLLASSSSQDDDEEILTKALTAQLSHSDGIRGFFVNYLTGEIDNEQDQVDIVNPADLEQIPHALLQAIQNIQPKDELISLSCMNVIMPTAMTTMHQDPLLAANSAKTAQRGTRILQALLQDDDNQVQEKVRQTCKAIYEVATTTTVEDDNDDNKATYESDANDIEYWVKFFSNWGYESQQKKDIASTMKDFIN